MALHASTTLYSTVCAALCVMSSAAMGQTRSDSTVFDRAAETARSDDSRAAEASTFTVNDVFERDVTDGCRYRSNVRGTVRMRPASTTGTDDTAHYVADLRIASQLQCGAVTTRAPLRIVRGDMGALANLDHAVSDASVMRTAVTGYACRYEPRFEFDGTQFQGRSIAQACRYNASHAAARGGGPRPPHATQPVPPVPSVVTSGRPSLVP